MGGHVDESTARRPNGRICPNGWACCCQNPKLTMRKARDSEKTGTVDTNRGPPRHRDPTTAFALRLAAALAAVWLALSNTGCANFGALPRGGLREQHEYMWSVFEALHMDRDLEDRILALDPDHIDERDITAVLCRAPAPRVININGGIYPVYLYMKSFSQFLIGMGYPEDRVRSPADGTWSVSCYQSASSIAGLVAWHYEKEGMRPMLIGHSQGGIQAIKVLHALDGAFGDRLPVWNPFTGRAEKRYAVIDMVTGEEIHVVGVKVTYASAVTSGGLTRIMPNQWSMAFRLRQIPDSVIEFTGFSFGMDPLGGDLMGFGPANTYNANFAAIVRNVRLPLAYGHLMMPDTRHLVRTKEMRDWINAYLPTNSPELDVTFDGDTRHILWAADVWHSIKKHWVLELQRIIISKRIKQAFEPASGGDTPRQRRAGVLRETKSPPTR